MLCCEKRCARSNASAAPDRLRLDILRSNMLPPTSWLRLWRSRLCIVATGYRVNRTCALNFSNNLANVHHISQFLTSNTRMPVQRHRIPGVCKTGDSAGEFQSNGLIVALSRLILRLTDTPPISMSTNCHKLAIFGRTPHLTKRLCNA